MENKYLFYCSIWCPLEDARSCIQMGMVLLKKIVTLFVMHGDTEGVTFFELTQDALRNLPALMVDNMNCFNSEKLDTMVFNIKEIKCSARLVDSLKDELSQCFSCLYQYSMGGEILVLEKIRVKEHNNGRIVGRKKYKIIYHEEFSNKG